jgi:hypothetical protein
MPDGTMVGEGRQVTGRTDSTDGEQPTGIVARLGTLIFGRVGTPEQSAANRGWILVLSVTTVAGLVLIFLLSASPRAFAGGCFLALAAAMVGSLAGFLFGLPRSGRTDVVTHEAGKAGVDSKLTSVTPDSSVAYRANTNLEDISDWLTKILVGLGLTQLGKIPSGFATLVATAQVVMGTSDDAAAIAGSLIVGYLILGFLGTYLWARTRLIQALRLGDADPTRLNRVEAQLGKLQDKVDAGPAT